MLVFIFVTLAWFGGFSQLPQQVFVISGSSQDGRVQLPHCQGFTLFLCPPYSCLQVLIGSGIVSDPAPQLPGFL